MKLHLLLAHTGSRQPVLPHGLAMTSVLGEPRPTPTVKPTHLYDLNGDPNDLPSQGWALVVPEGVRGERLLTRTARLRQHRAEQQHLRTEQLKVFRIPRGMTVHQTEEFRNKLLKMPQEEQPRYLLVLGDADEVSFEFQQHLAVDRFVGRLTFPQEEDFEVYADKILRAEMAEPWAERARTLFYTVHDGTDATRHGYERLMSRGLQSCRQSSQRGKFPASDMRELSSPEDPSVARLLESAAEPTPSVLMTLSHGNAGPESGWRSSAEQRHGQGAMVLNDGHVLTDDAVARRPFLPGGIWIYFACFSAGTPERSTYMPWLQRLKDANEDGEALESLLASAPQDTRPFVAALPQAALANPQGPLAVIGHVDLAWSYAYQDVDGNNHATRFANVLGDLVKHRRTGVGLHALTSAIASIDARLTMMYHQDEVDRVERGKSLEDSVNRAYLWMARHDLSSYVLLGDPAARLSIRSARW